MCWLAVLLIVLPMARTCWGDTDVPEKNWIANPDFEKDLSGWTGEGAVGIEKPSALKGTGCLRLGPGKGAVWQKYAVAGLQIIWFGARLKLDSADCGAQIRAQCFDKHDHLLLDLQQPLDPKDGKLDNSIGLYFKTQAHTAYLIVSIEKTTDAGTVYADAVGLHDDARDCVYHKPTVDLDEYLTPFWKSDTVTNETVLLWSTNGEPAQGKLLFQPEKIVSVRDYSLATAYDEGRDYTLSGNVLTATASSRMPSGKESDIPKDQFPWLVLPPKQIVVTYTHRDRWTGPTPSYQGNLLPRTMEKLKHRQPLVVVTSGDSITLGTGTSSDDHIPPYMPTWAEQFTRGLEKRYGDKKITLYNTALGGMTSQWGLDNADSTVAALDPDLVVIAYGMNDFWWMAPDMFQKNIQGIIDRVRERRPQAEFVLISSIRFDPAYTADPQYSDHMLGYEAALRKMSGPGVCVLDMTELSAAIYERKKPKDVLHDPLHPNDYLARWFAQAMIALFDEGGG